MTIKKSLRQSWILVTLMVFAFSNSSFAGDIYETIHNGDIDGVRQLIAADGDAVKATPLHCALMEGQKEIAILLIHSGADVNDKIYLGVTPLWLAADLGFYDVADLLIKKGADMNVENDIGETPFDQVMWAKSRNPNDQNLSNVLELLTSYGARMGSKNNM